MWFTSGRTISTLVGWQSKDTKREGRMVVSDSTSHSISKISSSSSSRKSLDALVVPTATTALGKALFFMMKGEVAPMVFTLQ